MVPTEEFRINEQSIIKEALILLNTISHDTQSLLVVNNASQMIGTLTDGDIRRGLIKGSQLTDAVSTIMQRDFKFIFLDDFDVLNIKAFRETQILFIPILDRERHIIDVINLRRLKSCLPIDAVLMAGGKGERLRPLTEKTPKPLLKVGDKAIIDHNIDNLISYGINNISVTVNYLKEQIEEHYSEPRCDVKINCYREPNFFGTIGSIKFVDKFHNDTILVMNSDLFTNINYEDFYLHFRQNNADMSVAAVPYNISIPYGILDSEGRYIKGLLEKPEYHYYANAGIYLIKRSTIEEIPNDTFFNATDLIKKLISQHKTVIRFPLNGTWIDIGTPQDYQKANDLVKHV
ncbi:MAG: nucleotidyltransferase family protein [Bacteroidales bacterium]